MLVFTKTKTENGTNSKFIKTICALAVLTVAFVFSGCYEISTVNQATTVTAGSQITTVFKVDLTYNSSSSSVGESYGIVGLMLPNGWTVDSVGVSGYFEDNLSYLPQGTADSDSGDGVDYWTDSLEVYFPSGDDMQWLVFQTDSAHAAESNAVDSAFVTIKMTAGETTGEFGLGYFITDAREDFTSEDVYDDSLNNMITVIPATDTAAGSYEIETVGQVSSAEAGSQIAATFSVDLELNAYAIERHGIVGLLVPDDWTVDSVSVDGYFTDNYTNLPQGTADADDEDQIVYWTDSLDTYYPGGDGMQWLVFQSDSGYSAVTDTTDSITVTVNMTIGETESDFGLGYFVSDSRGDFSVETAYDDSLNNTITVTPVTGIEDLDSSLPTDFAISQNYPNPFNPTTTINFSLPSASNVIVTLYNILGAKIMTITNGQYQAGTHQISLDATNLASGTYIYSISASGSDGSKFIASKKMVLLK